MIVVAFYSLSWSLGPPLVRIPAPTVIVPSRHDQLDRSQNLLGRIVLKYIQVNWTPGKVARILGAQPTEQFYNRKFGKYDAVVEDGLNTATQRQMQFAQMIQLRQLGVPITNEDLIESATLQGKKKIVENMQKQQQQAMQMQQQQAMMEMQESQARIKMTEASAVAADGLGVERLSRVAENQALVDERRAKAEQARSSGILEIIKAAKELETIDINQTKQVIELLELINAQQQKDKSDTEGDVERTFNQIQQQKTVNNTGMAPQGSQPVVPQQ